MSYDHKKIEKRWQERWEKEKLYAARDDDARPKFYSLETFPYPSAQGLHVGHPEGYTAEDINARYQRMRGKNVLYTMGWDAFGLPTENYALKIGKNPKEVAAANIANFKRQVQMFGFSYDWDREINTSSPEYYRWTQWFFLLLYKHGHAYRGKAPVNWCESCKTVLANEQVEEGVCERCKNPVTQREMEQWFLKITPYAERLLSGLDELDWPEPTKIRQRNWIGKSEGATISFVIASEQRECGNLMIEVFTTRPDTLFGATYLVLAPEHPLVASLSCTNRKEVDAYCKKAQKKSELERTSLEKEKTGVELKGVKAVNPATKEAIPIWVADYVIARYGTGTIMAVPAHDERDFVFAKKFTLPIRQVIAPEFGIRRENEERRDGGCGIVFNPATQKYAVYRRPNGVIGFFAGGVEHGEDEGKGICREITEESGLHDFAYVEKIASAFSHYHNSAKNVNRHAFASCYLVVLKSALLKTAQRAAHEDFELIWLSAAEVLEKLHERNATHDVDHWIWFLQQAVGRAIELGHDTTSDPTVFKASAFVDYGLLMNSGEFDGLNAEMAKWKITDAVGGKRMVQYRLRDWLVSRQRYWGCPIPMIECRVCGWVPVPEKDLPVLLPDDVDWRPSGEPPLARSALFVKTKCPKCGKDAKRATETLDTFVDSSWYYYRYTDPKNNKAFADKKKIVKWMPVDLYIIGAEHTVLHLLYSRFITKVLFDLGYVTFEEPFKKLRHIGLILGADGQKMSKSRGNVVNPDDVVAEYGADTLRCYEMFMGPLEDAKPWSTDGIKGVRRFLEKIWRLFQQKKEVGPPEGGPTSISIDRLLHKTIKKVTEDIESFKFNTAISSMMIFTNEVSQSSLRGVGATKQSLEMFLKVFAPFAPHLAEELWEKLGHKESIFKESWPSYDPKLIVDEEIELVVQVNGKVRDRFTISASLGEDELKQQALAREKVKGWLVGKKIERVVIVKGRLINIVVS